MTPHQRAVFDWVATFIDSQGFSPTYEEIAKGIGQGTRMHAHSTVAKLIEQGFLAKGPPSGKRTLVVAKWPPGPAMPASRPGMPRLARTLEQWATMVPSAVADGSRAQVVYALADAKADIASLAARLAATLPPSENSEAT